MFGQLIRWTAKEMRACAMRRPLLMNSLPVLRAGAGGCGRLRLLLARFLYLPVALRAQL
jgi:hypothetical protein